MHLKRRASYAVMKKYTVLYHWLELRGYQREEEPSIHSSESLIRERGNQGEEEPSMSQFLQTNLLDYSAADRVHKLIFQLKGTWFSLFRFNQRKNLEVKVPRFTCFTDTLLTMWVLLYKFHHIINFCQLF